MSFDALIHQTRERFPEYRSSGAVVEPLEKGGSARRYYRIRFTPEHSVILVKYQRDAVENPRFVGVANFLLQIGVHAPRIYYHDSEEGLIWMQDLGEEDLWHYRRENWALRRVFYRSTLDQVMLLHQAPLPAANHLGLLPPFDESLYRWEQNYCFENCFSLYFGCDQEAVARLAGQPAFQNLARHLARQPPVLIHRDLQSQNIIIWSEASYLIDFQGMRPGLAAYDLASLLFDPYAGLHPSERADLLAYYTARMDSPAAAGDFELLYRQCAVQRLLQALGAYGTIGLIRGKPEFLRHIAPALKILLEVASSLADFSFFAEFLSQLPERPNPKNASP